MRIANGLVSPEKQTKVYLGNKLSSITLYRTVALIKKRNTQNGGCGCGGNKRPKQVRKKVK